MIVAFLWVSGLALYLFGDGQPPPWQLATIDLVAFAYFLLRWMAPSAQHRTFHFILMCSYLASTAFYSYQMALTVFAPNALLLSGWWFEFFSNRLFECELATIIVYSLLRRRAKADPDKWHDDSDRWIRKVSDAKRAISKRDEEPGSKIDKSQSDYSA